MRPIVAISLAALGVSPVFSARPRAPQEDRYETVVGHILRVIVVEFANPVHQALLDRFIVDGDSMTREALSVVWRRR